MKTYFLRLIHYVIALGEFLQHVVLRLPLYAAFAPLKMKTASTIQEDSKLLKKIPAHVGILIVEDEFSFRDVANIIVWSVALGISYISVYDINGEIKRNSIVLQRNIEESKKEVLAQDQSNYDIQLFSTSHIANEASSTSSSRQKSHKANVHLLCIEDGHRRIVDMAKHMSHMVSSGMLRQEDIIPSTVDSFFQESLHFPDPELCLKFGSADCLFGYIPWQIRLTEIITMPSHKDIGYKSFLSSLLKYSNTSQRFASNNPYRINVPTSGSFGEATKVSTCQRNMRSDIEIQDHRLSQKV